MTPNNTPTAAVLLSPDVAESHAHLTALLGLCAQLPPPDQARTLRRAFEQQQAKGLHHWAAFVQRLPTYITQYLSADVQKRLTALLNSFEEKLRIAELFPENCRFWCVNDRWLLMARRRDVAERLALAEQEQRAAQVAEHTENLTWLDNILIGLDLMETAGGIALSRQGGLESLHHGQLGGPELNAAESRGRLVIVGGTPPPGWQPEPTDALALDTSAPSSPQPELPIDRFLSIARTTLDQLLLDAAMIEPTLSPGRYTAKEKVKPWQWANVRAALQERLFLTELSDEDAARLFTETYGAKVGRGTMQQRPQTSATREQNKRRIHAYKEFYDRLPVPKRLQNIAFPGFL